MLNKEQSGLLQKYLDGELSTEEQTRLEYHLANDTEFAEEVALEQQINKFLQHPITQARRIVDSLHQELFAEPIDSPTYTLDELLGMFAPHVELEEVVTRSLLANNVQKMLQSIILLPENGINCSNTLGFYLDETLTVPLQCQIYNNKRQEVAAHLVAANKVSFDVAFSLPPGRYYWELIPDRSLRQQLGTATGMFFVREDLIQKGN